MLRSLCLPRVLLAGMLIAYMLATTVAARHDTQRHRHRLAASGNKVQVDLYVMSKCPDAVVCEQYFASNLTALSSIIDLQVSHIVQQINSDGTQVTCMHGESECWGDIQQACALQQKQALQPDPQGHFPALDFLLCQAETYTEIPQNGNACIQSTQGLDRNDWTLCVNGEQGRRALVDSTKRSAAAKATTSCTVALNGEQWCIHDGEWKQCKDVDDATKQPDLITAVCHRYKGSNQPEVCR